MLDLSLFDFERINTIEIVAESISFDPTQGYAIIWMKLHKAPQQFLDWITKTKGVKLMTWFGEPNMRVWIPMKNLDCIKTHHGPIPTYVPNPDLD